MRTRFALAFLMTLLMAGTSLSGCLGNDDSGPPSANDLTINGALVAGDWSTVTLVAKTDLSVYIPYFVIDPGSKRAQNGTVLNLKSGASEDCEWLLPPRNLNALLLIGKYGRTDWPVRNQSKPDSPESLRDPSTECCRSTTPPNQPSSEQGLPDALRVAG